jgi:hypothetical protein
MLAVHLENLLFLLLLVVAGLFQLLGRAARKASTEDEAKPTSKPPFRMPKPIPRAPVESDEERIRKFLEALGQPPASRPPPPVVARTDIPPRPLAPVQPPTAHLPSPWRVTREERRKRRVILRESPPLSTETRTEEIVTREIASAQVFEIHEGPLPVEPPPVTPPEAYATATRGVAKGEELERHVPRLLVSTAGLREAIILREILGPPRGMRMQMEFAGGIS